ncbi:FtsX-like permease family protein [Nesterenkonia sp. F]|uniref:ABC transporter permease n=1 Tax=Nesterenkonia sp. F TaxID=795955 RepID=UPI000255D1F3|nr:FtsX-like permease family protein [Nesterenkonia sp. F]
MNPVLRANLRSGGTRLFAAGAAVAVAVAFVVACMLLVDSFTRTMEEQARADAAGADLVVDSAPLTASADGGGRTPDPQAGETAAADLAEQITDVDGVASAQSIRGAFAAADFAGREGMISVGDLPEHADHETAEGRLPQGADEALLPSSTAESYDVGVGDEVTVEVPAADDPAADPAAGPDAGPDAESEEVRWTVVGVTEASSSAQARMLLTESGMDRLAPIAGPDSIRVVLAGDAHGDPGAQTDAQERVAQAIADSGLVAAGVPVHQMDGGGLAVDQVTVMTNEQIVDAWVAQRTGDSSILLTIGLGFGAVAVFVAALVITTTFGVLIASRAKSLALMRAIGASAAQLKRATIAEGAVLGLAGSLVGVLLGWGAAVGLGTGARALWLESFVTPTPTVAAVVTGVVVGTVVTTAATFGPARRASSTSPMEALRPVDVAAAEGGVPTARTVVGLIGAVLGLGATVAAAMIDLPFLGVGGALIGFTGVLMASRAVVPSAVQLLGRLVSRLTGGSTVPRLVAQNARQVPGRTTTTTSALLVGITLVVTMIVGAATAQRSIDADLAEASPVDGTVVSSDSSVRRAAESDEAVEAAATVPGTDGMLRTESGSAEATIVVAPQDVIEEIARRDDVAPQEGTALVSSSYVAPDGVLAAVSMSGEAASAEAVVEGQEASLDVERAGWLPPATVLVSAADAERAGWTVEESAGQTWLRVQDEASVDDVLRLNSALEQSLEAASGAQHQEQAEAADASGVALDGASRRASNMQTIQAVLLVVLVLLAASVIVAVIGVSNTLALSVIERRREAALLRALGMSRGGVGSMVSVEALLMAGVALVLGTGLGVLFGWAGVSSLVSSEVLTVQLDVPIGQLGVVWGLGLLAAVLAAAIPARKLSRTAPAAGLSS